MGSYFTGEHDRIIEIESKEVNTSVREIHRLAFIVKKITEEAFVLPNKGFELDLETLKLDFKKLLTVNGGR